MVSEPSMPSKQRVAFRGISSMYPELLPPWFSEERSGTQKWQLLQSEGTLKKCPWPKHESPNFASLSVQAPLLRAEMSEPERKEFSFWVWSEASISKKEKQLFPVACSLSPGLPQHFYSSCNIPYLGPWAMALCGHILSPLLDHKLIENREHVYLW